MDTLRKKELLIRQDRSVEWLCAALMLAWAVTFMMPGDSLSLPSLQGFKHHSLGEIQWMIFFLVLGTVRMSALYINGRWPRTATIRKYGAILGAISWGQIAVMLFMAKKSETPWAPQILISVVLAIFELLCIRRARFDERYYHSR